MDDLKHREYNGWENRWTWLVHLHLSNEQQLFQEIARLVALERRNKRAGRLVQEWVKAGIEDWLTAFPGRDTYHDATIRLLVCDLVGATLAYTEWDAFVLLLMGFGKTQHNLFTATLFCNTMQTDEMYRQLGLLLQQTANVGVAADMLKDWFEEQVSVWIDLAPGQRSGFLCSQVFTELISNIYTLVFWEHVARAFRSQ
ncbi:MAG TPA: hypothetical protein VKP04_05335 [Ktedonobacteraceae bacterium]|nr:hypothetical protein [Ktedonobacteraceae bacterium]